MRRLEAVLDPATLCRFVLALDLHPLGTERTARAFARFFAWPARASPREPTCLTPGDSTTVARQIRRASAAGAEELVEHLRAEVAVKPVRAARIGFG